MILLTLVAAALAQQAPNVPQGTTVPIGVPLRVELEHRVAINRVGEPIRGRLVDPIYVFDRVVLPAGMSMEGHIAEIGGVPARRRFTALLFGNFTPPREVRAQFDALVLSDGSRLSLRTSLSRGTPHTVRVKPPRAKQEGPGQMSRLKSTLLGMLPYHRQAWPAGTRFNGVLQEPLIAPPPRQAEPRTGPPALAETGGQGVTARLLTPVNSATAHRGAPVEAIVTQPAFSTEHRLLIPEGSRLLGAVIEAIPARRFHRNGKVLFVFHQIQLPAGAPQTIQGYLEGVEADFDAHIALDSEGAARASSPRTRFIFPALAVAATGLSFHQDYNAQGVPDQDIAGRAESGAVGLGLIGTLLAQTSRTLATSIAFTGAGFSVYSTFLARGQDMILPANTPLTIGLKARRGGQPVKRRPHMPAASSSNP